MVFLKNLYYNVNVSEVQNTPAGEKVERAKFAESANFIKKLLIISPYQKYNDLVMQLGISKSFKKKKGECINHEKAD